MTLIGSERIPPSWVRQVDELIGRALAGDRFGVVEKLDALVKGYTPAYEFHTTRDPEPPEHEQPEAPRPAPGPAGKSIH